MDSEVAQKKFMSNHPLYSERRRISLHDQVWYIYLTHTKDEYMISHLGTGTTQGQTQTSHCISVSFTHSHAQQTLNCVP